MLLGCLFVMHSWTSFCVMTAERPSLTAARVAIKSQAFTNVMIALAQLLLVGSAYWPLTRAYHYIASR